MSNGPLSRCPAHGNPGCYNSSRSTGGGQSRSNPLAWPRNLKESELIGRREEDRRLWADWRFAATQYVASKDGHAMRARWHRHTERLDKSDLDNCSANRFLEIPYRHGAKVWSSSPHVPPPSTGSNLRGLIIGTERLSQE